MTKEEKAVVAKYEDQIRLIFTHSSNFRYSKKLDVLIFEVDTEFEVITYDKLYRLSELLGTDDIFLKGGYEYGYYDSVELHTEVNCRKVRK
jgi:hypothetical protein